MLARAAEDRRQAQLAAAAKKQKQAAKNKKGKKEEAPPEDEPEQVEEKKQEAAADEETNLFLPDQFAKALARKIKRPVVFGAVEFTKLNDAAGWDAQQQKEMVINVLENTEGLGERVTEVCIHGYRVMVKERNLKRPSSLLKHGRFLSNVEVRPVYPPEPEPEMADAEEAEEEEDRQDSD